MSTELDGGLPVELRVLMAKEIAECLTSMGYGAIPVEFRVHFYNVDMSHSRGTVHLHPDAITINYGNDYKVSYDELGDPQFFENIAAKCDRIIEERKNFGRPVSREGWRHDGS